MTQRLSSGSNNDWKDSATQRLTSAKFLSFTSVVPKSSYSISDEMWLVVRAEMAKGGIYY